MDKLNYYVYDDEQLIAAFVNLCTAETFVEEWRSWDSIPVKLVDANAKIIGMWVNGCWFKE